MEITDQAQVTKELDELRRQVRALREQVDRGLNTLAALSNAELASLASVAVAPSHQRKLRALLRKNRETSLTRSEQGALDELVVETNRIALLKAKALYTLTVRGKNGGSVAAR